MNIIERDANGLPVRLWLDGRRWWPPTVTQCPRCPTHPTLREWRCWTCWGDYSPRPCEQKGVIG